MEARMPQAIGRTAGIGLLCMIVFTGCAGPEAIDEADRPDAPRRCGFGETYSCVERIGRPVRCFCADKDTLRELLEPTME
jgi:hypothetical protein